MIIIPLYNLKTSAYHNKPFMYYNNSLMYYNTEDEALLYCIN